MVVGDGTPLFCWIAYVSESGEVRTERLGATLASKQFDVDDIRMTHGPTFYCVLSLVAKALIEPWGLEAVREKDHLHATYRPRALTRAYQANEAGHTKLRMSGTVPMGIAQDGRPVAAAAIDYCATNCSGTTELCSAGTWRHQARRPGGGGGGLNPGPPQPVHCDRLEYQGRPR